MKTKLVYLSFLFTCISSFIACQYQVNIYETPAKSASPPVSSPIPSTASPTATPSPIANSQNEIEAVIRSFADAINKQNLTNFKDAFDPNSPVAPQVEALFQSLVSSKTEYAIKELKVVSNEANKASVQAQIDITDLGGKVSKNFTYDLRLSNSKWKIFTITISS